MHYEYGMNSKRTDWIMKRNGSYIMVDKWEFSNQVLELQELIAVSSFISRKPSCLWDFSLIFLSLQCLVPRPARVKLTIAWMKLWKSHWISQGMGERESFVFMVCQAIYEQQSTELHQILVESIITQNTIGTQGTMDLYVSRN